MTHGRIYHHQAGSMQALLHQKLVSHDKYTGNTTPDASELTTHNTTLTQHEHSTALHNTKSTCHSLPRCLIGSCLEPTARLSVIAATPPRYPACHHHSTTPWQATSAPRHITREPTQTHRFHSGTCHQGGSGTEQGARQRCYNKLTARHVAPHVAAHAPHRACRRRRCSDYRTLMACCSRRMTIQRCRRRRR